MGTTPRFVRPLALCGAALAALVLVSCTDPEGGPGGGPDGGTQGECEVGTLGCECARGDTCATDLRGNALVCQEGVCVPPDCRAGDTGCVCQGGTTCTTAGDECVLGVCKASDCAAGSLHCDCLAGSCGAGLHCDTSLGGGTCVDGTGYQDGACLPNGLCYGQNRCDRDLDVCVHCEAGSQACAPREGDLCNQGLVLFAGRCLPPMDVPPPEEDRTCRTRCREDFVVGDDYRACRDGFLEGCIGDLACIDGSCVVPGTDPASCTTDSECPDFQRCFGNGRCYSECDANTDCLGGYTCYRHACRAPCESANVASAPCPSGMHCDTRDGVAGVCMPLPKAADGDDSGSAVRATYSLTPPVAVLNNLNPDAEIELRVDGPVAETFSIVKRSQHVFDASGDELVDPLAEATPLHFVQVSASGASTGADGSLTLTVPAACGDSCPTIDVEVTGAPAADGWARWEGELEVRHPVLGNQRVRLSYQLTADGRWNGKMFYFASFPQTNLDEWRRGKVTTSQVENGLVQIWGTYRRGRLSGGVDALRAVLTATTSQSWQWPSVASVCEDTFKLAGDETYPGACYLIDDGAGRSLPREYVPNLADAPIPTGATEYPIALNLRTTTGDDGLPALEGIIDSSVALHYPGYPAISLGFASSPFAAGACEDDGNPTDCVVYLSPFDPNALEPNDMADMRVGGRMAPDDDGLCPERFGLESFPWLLPDFAGDSAGGWTDQCRDLRAPFAAGSADNANLSRANPFRDGTALRRELRLVDGALIDQKTLFVLFEERFSSSIDAQGFSAFGYMLLEQTEQLVDDATLEDQLEVSANADLVSPDPTTGHVGPSCDLEWLRSLLGTDFVLPGSVAPGPAGDPARAALGEVVNVMLTGDASGDPNALVPYDGDLRDNVHALCVDTQLIDGGPDADTPVPCPSVSRVRYFVLTDPLNDQIDIHGLSCQKDPTPAGSDGDDHVQNGTCGTQLDAWKAARPDDVLLDPLWRCVDEHAVYCADDELDPMAGKIFYQPSAAALLPLGPMIQEAFRYKSRFQTDTNRSVGFAPVMCQGSGVLTPYCYDPVAMEEIQGRVDCLLDVYAIVSGTKDEYLLPQWNALRAFLSSSLSHYETEDGVRVADGFERLYAELLVMLGDEAFADALSSRFDLAATQNASFQGSSFEAHGIDLTGTAGFELRSLYQAAQYYDLANDRFFHTALPVVLTALDQGDTGKSGVEVVSQALVTEYLDRLIGGSTKTALTWSEIAVRYQSLNRPDLAEAVLARAYAATYLRSVVLSQLMLGVADQLNATKRDQIVMELEEAQHRYQAALDQMREVFTSVHDNVDVFGYSADYVPFPAVDDSDTRYANAFEAVLGVARLRMETARRFEDDAISASREFETDAASFQSELVQIARNYEDRLAVLCGSFRARDGHVYPAITKYAPLSDATAVMGDPCGRVGTGEIHEQFAQLQLANDDHVLLTGRANNLLAEIADENAAYQDKCGMEGVITLYNLQWATSDNQRISIQDTINGMQTTVSTLDRTFNVLSGALQTQDAFEAAAVGISGGIMAAASTALEIGIAVKQRQLLDLDHEMRVAELGQECLLLDIDRKYRVKELIRQSMLIDIEGLQLTHKTQLLLSELDRLYLEAQRIEEQEAEAERLAIDVEGARNDPNIRVYKNTAIINADRSFHRALEHAYRATRIYEYFTSQTYAGREDLYQIRMVSRGLYNLVSYLDELEDEYEAFRVEYRTRAHRVRRISLLDDIFQVPYQDDTHELSDEERFAILRERLLDPARIDENGHRVVEFRTFERQTAPCTFNHQIDYVEVDFVGQHLGDEFANVLIWQEGTGVIRSVDDGSVFYRLPPALVVAQPHFNNSQRFDPSIYRRYELRERPMINTAWRLIFDQHDDPDNQDVDVNGLKDIHIYVHYTDFTDPNACR